MNTSNNVKSRYQNPHAIFFNQPEIPGVMKWIRWVLLKIQSGHDSVHRRTDEQGETSIPPFQLRWSGGYNNVLVSIVAADALVLVKSW